MLFATTARFLVSFTLIAVVFATLSGTANAQGLSFSITPTIFDMAAMPGQAWTSAIKVVNNNPYPLTVYAVPVSFVPQGERGHGAFIPVPTEGEASGATLATWMEVTSDPIEIPAESSVSVPVAIAVPEDASPGGHYAAVMIGTRPPVSEGKMSVKTSQIISTLFFMRIAGDVVELGEVRTFRSEQRFATRPEMSFALRFENKGTVHLQPQGEIRITNMWGKERGIIPINQETNFGNVLPASTRLFSFSWKGEPSLTDIGRYRADLTLAYGVDERKFVTRSTFFYIIPVQPLLMVISFLLVAGWLITWSVRTYVRYMLRMSGIDPLQPTASVGRRYVLHEGDVALPRRRSVASPEAAVPEAEIVTPSLRERLGALIVPIRAGYQDLGIRLQGVSALGARSRVFLAFCMGYRRFFLAAAGLMLISIVMVLFIYDGATAERSYEVTIGDANPQTISSEEILRDRAEPAPAPTTPADTYTETTSSSSAPSTQPFTLRIVNAGATPGSGGEVEAVALEAGFMVDELSVDLDAPRSRSVIVYDPAVEDAAKVLSGLLGGMLLSAYADPESALPAITVYLGEDESWRE